jgi:hypothetical protein
MGGAAGITSVWVTLDAAPSTGFSNRTVYVPGSNAAVKGVCCVAVAVGPSLIVTFAHGDASISTNDSLSDVTHTHGLTARFPSSMRLRT